MPAADNGAVFVALKDVTGTELAFRHRAGCDRETKRAAREDRAEVAARAEGPSARVEAAADIGQLPRRAGERSRRIARPVGCHRARHAGMVYQSTVDSQQSRVDGPKGDCRLWTIDFRSGAAG